MKFFRIIFLASILLSLTACDLAYWDCKRELKKSGDYTAAEAAAATAGGKRDFFASLIGPILSIFT